jgi:pentatricopeptide repeat protein
MDQIFSVFFCIFRPSPAPLTPGRPLVASSSEHESMPAPARQPRPPPPALLEVPPPHRKHRPQQPTDHRVRPPTPPGSCSTECPTRTPSPVLGRRHRGSRARQPLLWRTGPPLFHAAVRDRTRPVCSWQRRPRLCGTRGSEYFGRQVHALPVKSEKGSHLVGQNALVTMYSKSGCVGDGFRLFQRISEKDLISWGSIISGLAQQGCGVEALDIFRDMISEGMHRHPNQFHFGSVFRARGVIDNLGVWGAGSLFIC